MALESTDFYMVTAQVLANIQNMIEKKNITVSLLNFLTTKNGGKSASREAKNNTNFYDAHQQKKSNPERDLPPR